MIAISFGMGLSLEEAQMLLRLAAAGQLDPRNKRDSVIIYGICSGRAVNEINDILFELGEQTL